ncbi:hypothetical protein BBBOND_0302600 [Babesia bigemina]|uniref:Uncharacterized protein n=1 Tax=Babesia bigemina TaxID=5866 RepID=A0A061D6P3_BABBI|nr:hypothetical protein BBBOND_0302600 [Babesia bigemina]CDR96356.1 hypothetical protein BBBOND_0302600 [Babesia bigemina]|eukprot:XP_012768542.1 hypothetical protein BBBOND_0302600 [Babesia bigemina]
MRDVEDISTLHGTYTELSNIIHDHRAVTRRKKRKSLTRERYAELQNALTKLEEQFKGIEQVASDILRFDNAAYFRAAIRQASIFIRQHTDQGSTQTHDEGTTWVGGDKSALESNTAGATRGRLNDLLQSASTADESNDTMRKLSIFNVTTICITTN